MFELKNLSNQLHQLTSRQFIHNLGYMGMAQIASRIFRLAASVTVARLLFPEDYGIAALALTVNEIIHVFVRGAVVTKLVQCDASQLDYLCNSAYWLNWLFCIALLIIQSLAGTLLALWYDKPELGLSIAVLSLSYLILPAATIQTALTLRDKRLSVTAQSETLQTLIDSLSTICLAIAGLGFWALVLPKLIAAPVWASVYRRATLWRPSGDFYKKHWPELIRFGKHIVAGDVVLTLRHHMDYLLIACFLDLKALGLYFFAYNAGLGITQGFIGAYTTTLYPHLCEAASAQQRVEVYRKTLTLIAMIAIPIIVIQSLLAPFYIPLIFGERWVKDGVVPLVILICLSALSRPFAESASQLVRANGQPHIDFIWQCLFTIILGIALTISLQWGLYGIAIATLLTHLCLQPVYTCWVITYTNNINRFKRPWRTHHVNNHNTP